MKIKVKKFVLKPSNVPSGVLRYTWYPVK